MKAKDLDRSQLISDGFLARRSRASPARRDSIARTVHSTINPNGRGGPARREPCLDSEAPRPAGCRRVSHGSIGCIAAQLQLHFLDVRKRVTLYFF